MKEFQPPISARPTEDLIAIAHSSTEEWVQLAIDQAKAELKKREISQEYIITLLEQWKEEEKRAERAYQRKLKRNEKEGYSTGEMIHIFLTAPLILLGKWYVDLSLSELKAENYQRKYKQRLYLLLCGFVCWILFFTISISSNSNEIENKRLEAIEKEDISEWEKSYYGVDSLEKSITEKK